MLYYPPVGKIIAGYDLNDNDEHYYEDVFEEQLTVICDWCKKRVDVPLEPPTAIPIDPLKQFDGQDGAGTKTGFSRLWPDTPSGKVILAMIAMLYLIIEIPATLLIPLGLLYGILKFIQVLLDLRG